VYKRQPVAQGTAQYPPSTPQGQGQEQGAEAIAQAFNVTAAQHPYLANEVFTKIANHLTTRSNVFAVYLTVGMFEVMDDTVRPPRLGAEVRTRSGAKVRHRMFAVVDRTNLAMDPTRQDIDVSARRRWQANKHPVFWTAQEGIPDQRATGPAPVTVTIAGGLPANMKYDPSYSLSSVNIAATQDSFLWVGFGRNQELARVTNVTPTATGTMVSLQFVDPAALTPVASKGHPGGVTLCNVLPGNPGPQDDFRLDKVEYKYVVPFYHIIQ
jgi:hypothetical protein